MMDISFGLDMRVVTGEFVVVPEPSAWWLGCAASFSWLIRRTKRWTIPAGR
jgi:hypothetical protein